MAVNEMSFTQVATILNSIQQQATGRAAITPTNTADFVACATTTLKTGYDPVMAAVNQVLTKTVFSIRPYTAKFKGMKVTESAYGNHVRKLSVADEDVHDDAGYKWPVTYDASQSANPTGDGQTVDMYEIKKPKVLQTNFYGSDVYQDHITVYKEQLKTAFTGPEQLGSFVSMIMGNMSDKLENYRENTARMIIANYVGGILDEGQNSRVIHLLTEYNTATGLSLTAQTVYQPANFAPFMRWVYARINSLSALMTERSQMFQTVVNDLPVMRHTPEADQRCYLFNPTVNQMTAQVLADTYNDELVKIGDFEKVNFWQSIETPDSISVTPSYIGTTGTVTTGSAVEQAGIFGVIMDKEAIGYATVDQESNPTPFNAKGRYSNIWFSETFKCWNDHTEKGIVLLLD